MDDAVLGIVDRSNQRGGRMLSVVDLIEAGTLSRSSCAWLLEHIVDGGSLLVGARPGGAGKTTIMSALLTMLPEGTRMHLTNPNTGWERAAPGECVVAYEISPGAYDAYVWGDDVRKLTELGRTGVRIVSNLHADTLDEAREQVVRECGASDEGFGAFSVFVPIRCGRGLDRVPRVERLDVWDGTQWRTHDDASRPSERQQAIAGFIDTARVSGLRACEQVREAWLRFITGLKLEG